MKRSTLTAAICWASVLASPQALWGQPPLCTPPVTKGGPEFTYAVVLTEALSWAKSSVDRGRSRELGTGVGVGDYIYALKLAQRDLECATWLLAPFVDSKIETIQTSALGSKVVFERLVKTNQEIVELLKDTVDGKVGSEGTMAERLADINIRADEAWKMLPLATVAATYGLVDRPSLGTNPRLVITAGERQALLRRLRETFGASIERGVEAGQLSIDAAAAALYGFLSDTRWTTRHP